MVCEEINNFLEIRLNIEVNFTVSKISNLNRIFFIARDSAPGIPLSLLWLFIEAAGVEQTLQKMSPVTFSKKHLAHARLVR